MIGPLLLVALIGAAAMSIATNRDVFSPGKFFLLAILVFFGDIAAGGYRS
jgi:hypothetical protein